MIRGRRVGRVRRMGRVRRVRRARRVSGWTLTKINLMLRVPRETRRKKDNWIFQKIEDFAVKQFVS